MKFVFSSPLSIEECRQRLKAKVDSPWSWSGTKRYVGKIGEQKIDIGYETRFFKNLSAPAFYGELQPEDGSGSRLSGSFQIDRTTKIFITIVLPLISLTAFLAWYLSGIQMDWLERMVISFIDIFPLSSIGMLIFDKIIGKLNEKTMIEFFTSTLNVNHIEQIDEALFSKLDWICIGIFGASMLSAVLLAQTF